MACSWRLFPCLVILLLAAPPVLAGDEPDEDEPFLPGLAAELQDGRGHRAVRLDATLAFAWGEKPPDPRLEAGPFRATWRGQVLPGSEGKHRFFVFGSGEVELKIAGKVVLARQALPAQGLASGPVMLSGEYQPFELSYRKTGPKGRLMVLWSGPDFAREPIPARAFFHPRERKVGQDFERGRLLARALRCAACHPGESASHPAPALDRLKGSLSRDWLIGWLTEQEHKERPQAPRRMPQLGLSATETEAIADWLLTAGESPASSTITPSAVASVSRGERLFVSLGCLACHSWRDLGASGWLGGGDLTEIADKRPPGFFAAWLADPARLNRDHRMPVFSLSILERDSLALFLAQQHTATRKPHSQPARATATPLDGRKLAERHCAACHRLPGSKGRAAGPAAPRLSEQSAWDHSCLGAPDPARRRPGYRLGAEDARAVRLYHAQVRSAPRDGRLLLAEHNCLACHAREEDRQAIPLLPPLLADKLAAVAQRYPDLAPQVPALTPTPLNSVGDKLTDAALVEAIARRGQPHRSYLQVRMPRFPLSDDDLQTLVGELIAHDRMPADPDSIHRPLSPQQQDRYRLAGGRLVSGDGFGCTSCHALGHVQPSNSPVNARGPDLSRLDRRIRRPWFDRWVRSPARIVPRMEMPSVQMPVTGVLDDRLDEQLAAVWHVLTLPDFEPPLPGPIRTLRHSGSRESAEPLVVTDVLQQAGTTRIKPFLVGLANRHNLLFDLEVGALVQWSVGDVARQRTRGKYWLWEPAGTAVLDTGLTGPELTLRSAGRDLAAQPLGQFLTEADAWQTKGHGLVLEHRLKTSDSAIVSIRQRITPLPGNTGSAVQGFVREVMIEHVPPHAQVRLRLLAGKAAGRASRAGDGRKLLLGDSFASRIVLREPAEAQLSADGAEVTLEPDARGAIRVVLHYQSEIPVDRFPETPQKPGPARKGEPVVVAPGFCGERLPLSAEIMPTGLSWRPDGRLVFCSLKGQVYEAIDTNGDGTEDALHLLADGLPAPYGVHAAADHVDVSVKYVLLRLHDATAAGRRIETLASGWGYSADYHNWAVGLPQNERGEYFLGIPCQEDRRSPAAARYHGSVLRLTPRRPTADDPHRFTVSPISRGHRFPMGLALDRGGELFVTDNQGNYKPFNELNHVRSGAHFGFINFLDRGQPAPPRTPSAIDVPHPWTRSVNGICFLHTPQPLRARPSAMPQGSCFGPLEGHLIGCEYDTRRLIRMSLQRVGDTFQGAAYPLSIPPSDLSRGFLGPLVCGVSPRGELYVGGIRDSGWGAGNNVGEIVRVQIQPEHLPCGIAEVRARAVGFDIDLFRPIDPDRGRRLESYTIQSYRREATPAYGGPDRDRRTEKVTAVTVAPDARRVSLTLAQMRPGFVYELRLRNLAPGGGEFHPAEAHYTLQVVPGK